jgi:hypothetical protein
MQRRTIHLWRYVVVLLVVAIWLYRVGSSDDPETPEPVAAGTRGGAVDRARPALAGEAELDPTLMQQRALDEYQQFAVYPPWSRPATEAHANNSHWNPPMRTIELSIGPNGRVETEGGDEGLPRYTQRLELDRLFAGPEQALTATLTVRRDNGAPVPFSAVGEVQVFDESLEEELGYLGAWQVVGPPVAFSADPADGTRTVGRFVPSGIADLAGSPFAARLLVRVQVEGFEPSLILEEFRYASRAPFVILDKVADRVVDGSLEVEFEVDVRQVRPVAVFALLSGAGGDIAVHDGFFRPTATGRQSMRITFFGKAIRDAGADGPYEVSALHGQVKLRPDDANFVWWGDDRRFSTNAYRAAEFSNAEWQSPEKDENIARMQEVVAYGE